MLNFMHSRPHFRLGEVEFMVDMACENCAKSVRTKLEPIEGVAEVATNVPDQTVRVTGSVATKVLLDALAETGRKHKLIGQGSTEEFGVSAAVAEFKGPVVHGVLRFAQVATDFARVEAAFSGLPPGPHRITVNKYGDLTRGAASTGGLYVPDNAAGAEARRAGELGVLLADGAGQAELFTPNTRLHVWDLIGRAVVVHDVGGDEGRDAPGGVGDDSVGGGGVWHGNGGGGPQVTDGGGGGQLPAGGDDMFASRGAGASVAGTDVAAVIARSAGVGQNLKRVCLCDGTVIWDARNTL